MRSISYLKKNRIPSILFLFVFVILLMQCKQKPTILSEEEAIDKIEDGIPVNVMLTAYSTTLLASDTTLLRVAMTDEKAREISTANDSIRLYIWGDGFLLDEQSKPLEIEKDSLGDSFVSAYLLDGLLHLQFVAPPKEDITKVEARAMNIAQRAQKVWPGSHEIHILPADFEDLQPSTSQLKPTEKEIERMLGADISFLPELEDKGLSFHLNGDTLDALKMLHQHGFNYIRIRIFVNPENEKGYAPNKDYCGLEKTLELAKRVHEEGFKILLDFHYSDTWADPQKQFKPLAWEGLTFLELADTLESYTFDVMKAFEEQGTLPEMVQVGNEINHGMIWPDGHISQPHQLAELLKAGIRGVKKSDKNIPIMLHVALGGQNKEAIRWFDNMLARDVDFDIIGLSYYPRWHGTLADLKFNMEDLINRYQKPINVVEYNWYKNAVPAMVFDLPNNMGKGSCVWEPLSWQSDMVDWRGKVNPDVMKIYEELSKKYLEKTTAH
jgi:hypothetical protein